MTRPHITEADMLAWTAELIRQTEAYLVHSTDPDMIAAHRDRIAMLRAIERRIAPSTYLTEEGES